MGDRGGIVCSLVSLPSPMCTRDESSAQSSKQPSLAAAAAIAAIAAAASTQHTSARSDSPQSPNVCLLPAVRRIDWKRSSMSAAAAARATGLFASIGFTSTPQDETRNSGRSVLRCPAMKLPNRVPQPLNEQSKHATPTRAIGERTVLLHVSECLLRLMARWPVMRASPIERHRNGASFNVCCAATAESVLGHIATAAAICFAHS